MKIYASTTSEYDLSDFVGQPIWVRFRVRFRGCDDHYIKIHRITPTEITYSYLSVCYTDMPFFDTYKYHAKDTTRSLDEFYNLFELITPLDIIAEDDIFTEE